MKWDPHSGMLPRMASERWERVVRNAGYTIVADAERLLLSLCFWGEWDDDLARDFERSMHGAMHAIPVDQTWSALVDLARYPLQRPSVTELHIRVMRQAARKIERTAKIVSSDLTPLQLRQRAEELGAPSPFSFFANERDARAWLGIDSTSG